MASAHQHWWTSELSSDPGHAAFWNRSGFGQVSYAGDVGGEEMDTVPVEVAASAVVVLGGAWVGVPSQDLGIPERNAGVEGVGDRDMAQRVRADMAGNAGRLGRTGSSV
jgi:hypothetical protein